MVDSRRLSGPTQARSIRDLLQSIFAAELLRPSRELWFLSAWVSDIPILDNRAHAFTAFAPDWPTSQIRLSRVLGAIAARGASVHVAVREDDHNLAFCDALVRLPSDVQSQLSVHQAPTFHEKGIVGDDYVLEGSMNFTHSGIAINDEHVTYTPDAGAAAERQITLRNRWLGREGT